jgi:hypothetical protein
MNEMNKTHADATIKGAVIGLLAYVGVQFNLSPELVALLVPVVAGALSMVSTKIGDKNTALLLKLATEAVKSAPELKAPAKKAPAKKAPAKKAK